MEEGKSICLKMWSCLISAGDQTMENRSRNILRIYVGTDFDKDQCYAK